MPGQLQSRCDCVALLKMYGRFRPAQGALCLPQHKKSNRIKELPADRFGCVYNRAATAPSDQMCMKIDSRQGLEGDRRYFVVFLSYFLYNWNGLKILLFLYLSGTAARVWNLIKLSGTNRCAGLLQKYTEIQNRVNNWFASLPPLQPLRALRAGKVEERLWRWKRTLCRRC